MKIVCRSQLGHVQMSRLYVGGRRHLIVNIADIYYPATNKLSLLGMQLPKNIRRIYSATIRPKSEIYVAETVDTLCRPGNMHELAFMPRSYKQAINRF